jgi:hypothetical protein
MLGRGYEVAQMAKLDLFAMPTHARRHRMNFLMPRSSFSVFAQALMLDRPTPSALAACVRTR